ncbi:hypothetical protein [Streptomyces sp. NBC_01763]|uniref:hypothetical protein n=1 Tax=Streptomyces sp. NBC_01763 TaxID=2975934 RepID=UPI002DD980BD|nr:hypothetical protein [Streptomyces sp. NBC_01763]WSC35624.1 hypothetical protein OHA08_09000 [Streptomyces sp. NBC_01763]
MPDNTPQAPAYQLPDSRALSTAAHEAMNAYHAAAERLGRVMAVVTAAAVRDIMTGNDSADVPFDATHAELMEAADGSLHATGRYWTADGTETSFTATLGTYAGDEIFDMNEWVPYLNHDNERVWKPLVTKLPERDGRAVYRIDLAKAAGLPLD